MGPNIKAIGVVNGTAHVAQDNSQFDENPEESRTQRRARERMEKKRDQKAAALLVRAKKAQATGDKEAQAQVRKELAAFKRKYYKKQ